MKQTKIVKIENQTAIIGVIIGFSIGVLLMILINIDKESRLLEKIAQLEECCFTN